jgi:hypothetical protein
MLGRLGGTRDRVSEAQLHELLHSPVAVYQLTDGRTLILYPQSNPLPVDLTSFDYPEILERIVPMGLLIGTSPAEYVRIKRQEHVEGNHHVLYGVVYDGSDFPNRVPDLIGQLQRKLKKIPLDYSDESLRALEEFWGRGRLRHAFERPNLNMLIAYLGEVLRRQKDGQWHMQEPEPGVWEPVIMDASGRTWPFATDLAITIFDARAEGTGISFESLLN